MERTWILAARATTVAMLLLAGQASGSDKLASRRSSSQEIPAVLSVCVDTSGKPYEVTVVRSSGNKSMDLAAVKAAKKWHFDTTKPDGTKRAPCEDVPITMKVGG